MIKSNLVAQRLAKLGKRLSRRHIVLIAAITLGTLAVVGTVRVFPGVASVVARQPAQSEEVMDPPKAIEQTGSSDLLAAAQSKQLISPAEASEAVYLVSWVFPDDPAKAETGRLRLIHRGTGQVLKVIDTGYSPDMAVSPDGRRLFLAATEPGPGGTWNAPEDYLTAYDTATWSVHWRRRTDGYSPTYWSRLKYIGGGGPSAIMVSPDGSRLIIYKYSGHDSWITVMDPETGEVLADSTHMSYCDAADLTFSPDGQWLYFACYGSNDIRFMNVATLQIEQKLTIPGASFATGPDVPPYTPNGGVPGAMAGTAMSPDGRWLYVITNEPRLVVVDLRQRSPAGLVDLGAPAYNQGSGVVALSPDGGRLFVGVPAGEPDSGVDEIRVFDTQSWEQVGQLRPAENMSQLLPGGSENDLYLLFTIIKESGDHSDHFSIVDLGSENAASPLDLPQNERPVRLVLAP